ncbi:eukaryotic translation initiation factor 5B [Drosophila elegans]|uniref:eukaryotic translation initiation factor 5B n=1 Tax=Drosophila elegans TaxID=30023 RepID=UPI0007E6E7D8|nr:eukaryotic translation initiation factor 5B [Drosophila elegans]
MGRSTTSRTMDKVKGTPRVNKDIPKTRTSKGTRDNSRRYREKIKNDPIKLEEYRAREAERSRIYRKKINEVVKKNKKALKSKRETDRLRQQRYRDKKKEEIAKQKSMEEIFRKLERALPKKMDQKIEVIKVLYSKYVEPEISES